MNIKIISTSLKFKANIILLVSFFLKVTYIYATTVKFQKTYGGVSDEYGYATEQLRDGGFIMCGRTISYGVGGFDNYLVRLKENGDTLWTKTYGNTGYDEAQSIIQTNDGGFIMVGQTATVDWAGDVYLLKTDSNGVVMWSTAFGSAGKFDFGYSVKQTSDGGYIIAGMTNSVGAGLRDMLLIKTNSNGVLQWSKTYGGSSDDEGRSVEETTDGGYIISGFTQSFGSGYQMYLVKTSATGNISWTKTFGGGGMELGYSVKQTSDGGYVLLGYSDSYGSGLVDALLIKLTSSGSISWSKTYGGSSDDYGLCIKITNDGGYIISGRTSSFGSGSGDFYLIKTNNNGVVTWSKAYGGSALDQAGNVIQTADGGYLVTGYTLSFGAGIREAYIIKTDDTGITGCNETNASTQTTSPTVLNSAGATEGIGLSVVSPVTATRRVAPIVTVICFSNPCNVSLSNVFQSNVTCKGGSNGQINVNVNGGVGPYTFNWSPGSPSGDGTSTINNLSAGDWTCTVSDANACSYSQSFTITEPPLLNIISGHASIQCHGDSTIINISANGGTPPYSGIGNYTVNAGIYSFTITDANSCESTLNETITEPSLITTNFSTSICEGSSFQVGSSIYTTSGNYTDVLTSTNGCDSIVNTLLTVNQLPTISITNIDSIFCINTQPVTLNAIPAGGLWSGQGINGNSFSPALAGVGTHTIVYTYTDSVQCSNNSSINMIVDLCTSVNNIYKEEVIIFPNPTKYFLHINTMINYSTIELIDNLGKCIISTNQTSILNVSTVSKGIYFLKFTDKNGNMMHIKKILID